MVYSSSVFGNCQPGHPFSSPAGIRLHDRAGDYLNEALCVTDQVYAVSEGGAEEAQSAFLSGLKHEEIIAIEYDFTNIQMVPASFRREFARRV
jgi:hypothetical protein